MGRRKAFEYLLKSRNITAYDLAKKLGCKHSRVYKWVYGISEPNAKTFLQLAEILDVSTKEILQIFAGE